MSQYETWDQKSHAESYMIFPENIGEHLSIDETSLSKGELYTYVTNKAGKGKKGTLVASIKGTKVKEIVEVLSKLPIEQRLKVKSITLDMAKNMEAAVRQAFPTATLIIDHFHVARLTTEALQHMRIDLRWQELENENQAIAEARKKKIKYKAEVLTNEDTPKQLLARSRFVLAKNEWEWTDTQKQRAVLLFERYPDLEPAYEHVARFRSIYRVTDREEAKALFLEWIAQTEKLKLKCFYTVANTVKNNLDNILNYFIYRLTNANAESFNSKIKLFRANQRGVRDVVFFQYRLSKLFA